MARATKDISERRTLLRLGRKLVSQLFVLLKTFQLYEESNTIAIEASEGFRGALSDVLDAAPDAALHLRADCLFINEHRLRLDLAGFAAHRFLVETLRSRRVRTIRFGGRPTAAELTGFLKIFLGPVASRGATVIADELERFGISLFTLEEFDEEAEDQAGGEPNTREATVDTYFKSIFVVKQIVERGITHRGPNLRRAKKVVHAIVDLLFEDQASLMALTAIRSYDNRTFNHSANVCILAVILGRQLTLTKRELGQLGIAALLHDIGKMAHYEAEKRRAGAPPALPSDDDEAALLAIPREGVKALVRYQGLTDIAVRSAIVAWEHRRSREPIGLHSRIVSIADFYENLTAPGTVSETGVSPEEALRVMLESDACDPLLTRVFASALGAVPLGSLVELDSGAFAVVIDRDLEGGRLPTVRLVATGADGKQEAGATIDLRRPPEGCAHREILRALPVGEAFETATEVVELVEARAT